MLPNRIKAILTQRIPDYLIKERDQGKTKLSYISGSTVTGILNQAFGFDWDWIIENEWITESQGKINKYKNNEIEVQPPVAHVRGVLVVRYIDENGSQQEIKKTGHGSKVIIGGASEQDSIFKASSTDALKKAASLLGVGLQLYRDANELAYFETIDFIDPWDDELRAKYQADFEFLEQFKTNFDDPSTVLDQYAYAFSNGSASNMSFITPANIQDFVAYCRSALN